ncbi:apyrase-like [Lutzomyia longipalpis]|uniref:apyrase-like n=1 Tax=Lutzomyia longipalpis TaxID=7200 RepID=UPI0024834B9C|nr:apyrase-like [Lutzomyia longipalpis]
MGSVKYFYLFIFVLIIFKESSASGSKRRQRIFDEEYKFEIIADYDEKAISTNNPYTYDSNIWIGTVQVINETLLNISFTDESYDIVTRYAHNGRGAELSELLVFNGKMYTFEDKTGIIFDVSSNRLIPWVILGDGAGNETNGFKCEWATVKDDHIYVGSNGLENYHSDGQIENLNHFWIKKVSKIGQVFHENWFHVYEKIRSTLGMSLPGFIVHEAVVWSPINRKWIFIPRKCSSQPFLTSPVDYIGCNKIIFVSEDFSTVDHIDIQANPLPPERGFSSFKFLPDSNEQMIVALTTVETPENVSTSIIAMNLDGRILSPERKIIDAKYEGLAFLKHIVNHSNTLNFSFKLMTAILVAQIFFSK